MTELVTDYLYKMDAKEVGCVTCCFKVDCGNVWSWLWALEPAKSGRFFAGSCRPMFILEFARWPLPAISAEIGRGVGV
jgi:hypothetical protein